MYGKHQTKNRTRRCWSNGLKQRRSFFEVSSAPHRALFRRSFTRTRRNITRTMRVIRCSNQLSTCRPALSLNLPGFWLMRCYLHDALHRDACHSQAEVDVCRLDRLRKLFLQKTFKLTESIWRGALICFHSKDHLCDFCFQKNSLFYQQAYSDFTNLTGKETVVPIDVSKEQDNFSHQSRTNTLVNWWNSLSWKRFCLIHLFHRICLTQTLISVLIFWCFDYNWPFHSQHKSLGCSHCTSLSWNSTDKEYS